MYSAGDLTPILRQNLPTIAHRDTKHRNISRRKETSENRQQPSARLCRECGSPPLRVCGTSTPALPPAELELRLAELEVGRGHQGLPHTPRPHLVLSLSQENRDQAQSGLDPINQIDIFV